jgi:Protein of unknown function DUF72/Zinc-binding dehydrogenase
MTLYIGTSGWSYDHWSDVLYPPGAPSRERLRYYTQSFQTVELNSSFYRWPRLATFRAWKRRLPTGFRFSVKAPRGLTHAKKLYAPEAWTERIAACWHELADKRAVLLVQLGPDLARDDARLGYFLELLPQWVQTSVEFRHPSWTGRAADRQKALDFGAAEFVDLDNDALEDVGGVDLAFDVIGGDIGKRSAGLIRAGGTVVSVVGPPEARPADGLAIDFVVEPDRAQLGEVVQRVRDGRLRTNIGNVATLDDAVAALNPTDRVAGKTIIRIRP